MTQLQVQILHQDYVLTCPEGREAQLIEAAERVDHEFQAMRDRSKLRSRERVGVLLAINLAFENLELREQLQTLQQELASLQGTEHSPMADTENAHVQELQAQAERDQAKINHLITRLDQVLAFSAAALACPAPTQHLLPGKNSTTESA